MDWNILSLESVDSTNVYLAARAAEGAPEGTVVCAREQTAGRGRQGRPWISRPGAGLYFSALLRPAVPPDVAMTLPLVAGLAVAEAVQPLVPEARVQVKWPNDLQIDGRKLCGILCEMQTGHAGARHVILGIGVNVNLDASSLPPEIASAATSLRAAAGRPFEAGEVLGRILGSLGAVYAQWLAEGFASLLPRLAARDALLGRSLTIGLVGVPVSGTAAGISPSGALLLAKPDGSTEEVYSGEAHVGVPGA